MLLTKYRTGLLWNYPTVKFHFETLIVQWQNFQDSPSSTIERNTKSSQSNELHVPSINDTICLQRRILVFVHVVQVRPR